VRPHPSCVYRRLRGGKSLVAGRGYAQRSSSVRRPPSLAVLDLIPTRYSGRVARALRAGVARAPIRQRRIGRRSHGWRSAGSFERAEAWRAAASVRRQGTGTPTHAGRRCSPLKNSSKNTGHLRQHIPCRTPLPSVAFVHLSEPEKAEVFPVRCRRIVRRLVTRALVCCSSGRFRSRLPWKASEKVARGCPCPRASHGSERSLDSEAKLTCSERRPGGPAFTSGKWARAPPRNRPG